MIVNNYKKVIILFECAFIFWFTYKYFNYNLLDSSIILFSYENNIDLNVDYSWYNWIYEHRLEITIVVIGIIVISCIILSGDNTISSDIITPSSEVITTNTISADKFTAVENFFSSGITSTTNNDNSRFLKEYIKFKGGNI